MTRGPTLDLALITANRGRPLPTVEIAQCAICAAPLPVCAWRRLCWAHQQLLPGGAPIPEWLLGDEEEGP